MTTNNTREVSTRAIVRSIDSKVVGSIQCASSTIMRTGLLAARPITWSVRAASVCSFCRSGGKPRGGYRSPVGIDRSGARRAAVAMTLVAACPIIASSLSSFASGVSSRVESSRPLKMLDDRVERAVRMVGRALQPDAEVFVRHHPLTQHLGDPRFADAGLARDQHDLTLALLRLRANAPSAARSRVPAPPAA